MMILKKIIAFTFIGILSSNFSFAQQAIDPAQSTVGFTISNLGIDVKGSLRGMNGTIQFDPVDLPNSTFEINIPVKTIRTGNRMRDDHLKNEDFFEVDRYPAIEFKSDKVVVVKEGFELWGRLTIRNVTQVVSIPFTYSEGQFKGGFTIDRTSYGLGGNGFLNTIGKEVMIEIKSSLQ